MNNTDVFVCNIFKRNEIDPFLHQIKNMGMSWNLNLDYASKLEKYMSPNCSVKALKRR